MPRDDRYREAVNGIIPEKLGEKMIAAHDAVKDLFPPHTGIMIFAFDFGKGGGVSYISNGDRGDCLNLVAEWLEYQRRMN